MNRDLGNISLKESNQLIKMSNSILIASARKECQGESAQSPDHLLPAYTKFGS